MAMPKGAADAGLPLAVAVIGGATSLHAGVRPLMDTVVADTDMTVLILDNQSADMTARRPTAYS